MLNFAGTRIAPDDSNALNPAFDVTPAALLTAIITERGILRAPLVRAIADATTELAAAR